MKLIREFEERIREEYQQGKLPGFIHMYRNQEAIAVAACMHLGNDDYIDSTHRGHGHCIAKGCDIEDMLLELACKQDGLCKGKGGSMHIADMSKGMLGANAIVGGGPPIAAGAALTARTLGNGMVSMAFIGDGASDQEPGPNRFSRDTPNSALPCAGSAGDILVARRSRLNLFGPGSKCASIKNAAVVQKGFVPREAVGNMV